MGRIILVVGFFYFAQNICRILTPNSTRLRWSTMHCQPVQSLVIPDVMRKPGPCAETYAFASHFLTLSSMSRAIMRFISLFSQRVYLYDCASWFNWLCLPSFSIQGAKGTFIWYACKSHIPTELSCWIRSLDKKSWFFYQWHSSIFSSNSTMKQSFHHDLHAFLSQLGIRNQINCNERLSKSAMVILCLNSFRQSKMAVNLGPVFCVCQILSRHLYKFHFHEVHCQLFFRGFIGKNTTLTRPQFAL